MNHGICYVNPIVFPKFLSSILYMLRIKKLIQGYVSLHIIAPLCYCYCDENPETTGHLVCKGKVWMYSLKPSLIRMLTFSLSLTHFAGYISISIHLIESIFNEFAM